ncbi:MAG: hypothetical protein GKC04_00145 [Methanomicrobiales archaeon]|nr:hypothetical protein [Methanomicrobiales archaeon]
MGFVNDSMHTYIERDLKKKYPASEGWKIERDPAWDGVKFDYQVSKRRFGVHARYLVEVVIEKTITASMVGTIKGKIEAVNAQGVSSDGVVLIIPTGADVSAVPDGMETMFLKVLKVEDNDILWWRKAHAAE